MRAVACMETRLQHVQTDSASLYADYLQVISRARASVRGNFSNKLYFSDSQNCYVLFTFNR
jgi:hypothetical protein